MQFWNSANDQPSHRERWELYLLPFPISYQNLSSPSTSYDFTSAEKKTEKKSYASASPYHHYAIDSKKKKLGLSALTVLIFYEVCGGPFGIEDIVRAGGPLYALLGFSLLLVWAVPEALITAELSTAMPEASGSVAWVDVAFGPFWAFQKGWLSWLSGVADNALYPILFLDCLVALFADSSFGNLIKENDNGSSSIYRLSLILILTVTLTYCNYLGLDIVGQMAIIICIISLIPFVVLCVIGSFQVQPERWLEGPPGGLWGVDWRLFLNTFFWNINFWESAASFSGEVEDPGRNYPLGMLIAVCLVFVSLFVPVLICTGASNSSYTEWKDGYFIQLARQIVGPWLAYWLMFAAAITNIGMFEAEMSSDSWQIAGMADRGILPKVLGTRSRSYETPIYGILMSASGVIALCTMSFSEVIDMLNLLFCYGQAIEFVAFLELRRSHPKMKRPYQIGVGYWGMVIMLLFPFLFILIILSFSSWKALTISGLLAVIGVPIYYCLEYAKINEWCHFEDKYETIPSTMLSTVKKRTSIKRTQSNGRDAVGCGVEVHDEVGDDEYHNLVEVNGRFHESTPLLSSPTIQMDQLGYSVDHLDHSFPHVSFAEEDVPYSSNSWIVGMREEGPS